jgi:hypothetical protein
MLLQEEEESNMLSVSRLACRLHAAGRQVEASLPPIGYEWLWMVQQTNRKLFGKRPDVLQDDRELGENTFGNVHTEHWIQDLWQKTFYLDRAFWWRMQSSVSPVGP